MFGVRNPATCNERALSNGVGIYSPLVESMHREYVHSRGEKTEHAHVQAGQHSVVDNIYHGKLSRTAGLFDVHWA